MRVAISVGSLFLFVLLAQAGDLFLPRIAAAPPEGVDLARVVDIVNAGFRIGMAVAAVITLVEIWRGLRRLKTLERRTAHAGLGPRARRAIVDCPGDSWSIKSQPPSSKLQRIPSTPNSKTSLPIGV